MRKTRSRTGSLVIIFEGDARRDANTMRNTPYKPLLKGSTGDTSNLVERASERVSSYLRFIAANTRKLRLLRGMTQEGLAEMADLDLRFIQRIERGSTNLSVGALIALSDALGVRPANLFRAAKLTPPRPGRPRKRPTSVRPTHH
jgi:ribosome-binding protein aMBF1 (putative translation factor)